MNAHPCLRSTLAVSFAVFFGFAAIADVGASDRGSVVSLRSGVIDTRALKPSVPEHLQVEPADGSSDYVLVKYAAPVSAAQRQALEDATERIYSYLPHFAYLVRMPAGFGNDSARTALAASWIGPYHPAYKLSPSIAAAVPGSGNASGKATARPIQVMIHAYPDADLTAVIGKIRDLGIDRVAGSGDAGRFARVRLLLTTDEIVRHREALARIPEVFWIDTEGRRVLLNDATVWVGQTGLDGGTLTTVFGHGIYGQGQILAVLDTGIDPDMCFFRDPAAGPTAINACDGGTVVDLDQRKLIAVDFLWDGDCESGISDDEWDNHDHGTHVAGSAAGDNFASPLLHDLADGMAPGARLVMQDGGFSGSDNCADLPGLGCPVVDLVPLFQQTYDQGARIHSNSWGDQENAGFPQSYSAASQDADQFMWDHKDFLLVFAAGNSGPGAATVLSPSNAKSVVAVGATQPSFNAESLAGFSSCGPVFDGRIKPEVTIPGQSILSADNDGDATSDNCTTRLLSGTSMSTPATAGFAALVRQYFEEGWYPSGAAEPADAFTPSGALLRGALVNSAKSMANAPSDIPGGCQGWGRILLEDMLYFDGDDRRLWVVESDGFAMGSSGELREWNLDVFDSAEPLEITLAWTDFPSTPAADPNLNNDLDLEVVGPGGLTFRGNVFIFGESSTGGSADRLNTLEQVFIITPSVGQYTVRVRSFNVPDGPQPFSLLATGAMAESSLIFGDGFESGDTSAWE